MTHTLLRIDSSANLSGSHTRALADEVITQLAPDAIVSRDVAAHPLPQIDQAWSAARLVPADDRTDAERAALALSDELIAEMRAADTLVITAPIYNFSIPASLKLWIDLIARPKETFAYTENGPKGLLEGKRAIIVMASGGVPIGSDYDFASNYLRHVVGFVGITDVTLVTKDTIGNITAKAA